MLREVINNAVKVAKTDGYNQIIYSDENGYTFSRGEFYADDVSWNIIREYIKEYEFANECKFEL